MNRWSSERGGIEGIVAVVLCVGAATVFLGGAWIVKYNTTNYGTYKESPPLAVPDIHFIGPAPSTTDEDVASCQRKKAENHGAFWTTTGEGWRAPKLYPTPLEQLAKGQKLDAATLSGQWQVWTQGMNGLMANIREEWVECKPKGADPPPALPDKPKMIIGGTYNTVFSIDSKCLGSKTVNITSIGVSQGPPFGISLNISGIAANLKGTLSEDDLTFRAQSENDVTNQFLSGDTGVQVTLEINMAGRFDTDFDERTIIREGRGDMALNSPKGNVSCPFTFTAKRPA